MPIIKPEVQKVLRAAGLAKDPLETKSLEENLDLAGLSNESIAEELASLALRSTNENYRIRALETALKIKGALKVEAAPQIPQFTIVIQSSEPASSNSVPNPIVFPRQSLKHFKSQEPEAVDIVNEEDEKEPDEYIQ